MQTLHAYLSIAFYLRVLLFVFVVCLIGVGSHVLALMGADASASLHVCGRFTGLFANLYRWSAQASLANRKRNLTPDTLPPNGACLYSSTLDAFLTTRISVQLLALACNLNHHCAHLLRIVRRDSTQLRRLAAAAPNAIR